MVYAGATSVTIASVGDEMEKFTSLFCWTVGAVSAGEKLSSLLCHGAPLS